MNERIKRVIKFLHDTDFTSVESGRYYIDESMYYNVDIYLSKKIEEGKYESHRKYIDIQYIVEGEECIYVSDIHKLIILEPYNENKDVIFYENNREGKEIILRSGEYAVFYPEDGHMPGIASDMPKKVKKVVVKVPIE